MKKITDIYKEYKIMQNLQMHQYRVAAVAFQICDSLEINVDKDSVIKSCLLHDMGNIIKFNLSYFPEFNKPEGIEYWQDIQNQYLDKYGKDEHYATLRIADELGVNDYIIELLNSVDPLFIEANKNSSNIDKKICIYADNRVDPNSIVSLDERSLEAKKRYENHPHSFDEENRIFFNKNIKEIEKQIFEHSKIKPEDINNESIVPYLEKLKFFEI